MKKLVLVGGGAFSRELINWIHDADPNVSQFELVGYLDSTPNKLQALGYDIPYLGLIEDYIPAEEHHLLMAINDPVQKERIVQILKEKSAKFIGFIHHSAVIASTSRLGEGVIVCPQSFVSANTIVGDFVFINGLCSIGHDVVVGDYSTLSAHVDLTGYVKVGRGVFFGTSAKVIPKIIIGDGARIGAGALIMRNVKDHVTMYEMPSRKL